MLEGKTNVAAIDMHRFSLLHPQGKQLIRGWFQRAWEAKECLPSESFEPFIFCWIALNGWAACISGIDSDAGWKRALMIDSTLNDDFARMVNDQLSPLSKAATQFHSMWPVFRAQTIRIAQVEYQRYLPGSSPRKRIVDHYLQNGITNCEPKCWHRHRSGSDPVPLDWPHTLAVLYRVRCNLFHGEKSIHSEMDQRIVHSAFNVLVHFLEAGDYLETRWLAP